MKAAKAAAMITQCDIRGCGGVVTTTKVRVDSLGRQTPQRGIVQFCTFHGDDRWADAAVTP